MVDHGLLEDSLGFASDLQSKSADMSNMVALEETVCTLTFTFFPSSLIVYSTVVRMPFSSMESSTFPLGSIGDDYCQDGTDRGLLIGLTEL